MVLCGLDPAGGGAGDEPGARLAARCLRGGLSAGGRRSRRRWRWSGSRHCASKGRHRRSLSPRAAAGGARRRLRERRCSKTHASVAFWRAVRDVEPFAVAGRPRRVAGVGGTGARRRTRRGDRPAPRCASGISIGAAGSCGWRSAAPRMAVRRLIRAAIRGADGHGTGHATLIRGIGGVAPRGAGVRAAAAGARGTRRPRQGQLRPAPYPEPRPHGRAELSAVRTDFTEEQLADPDTAQSEKILRTCTHCGFCTATCPTYLLLGDELDSPRGRIYLIKDMLASRRGAERRHGQAHRPLPVVPRLHDDLPVGGQLHAPRRPRPALDRGEIPPALGRAGVAADARRGADPAVAVPPGIARRRARPAVRAISAEPPRADAGAGAGNGAPRLADRPPARVSGRGRAGGCASRCCPAAPSGCWRRRSTRRRSGC